MSFSCNGHVLSQSDFILIRIFLMILFREKSFRLIIDVVFNEEFLGKLRRYGLSDISRGLRRLHASFIDYWPVKDDW